MLQKIKPKKFKLGIVGGGPGSWIGHVHRISSRYDDKYEIVAGVFSRSVDKSRKFGQSIGLDKSRCYSNYKEMSEKEAKRKDGISVVAIMTPPSSHQIIAENFIKKNIHVISDKPFAGNLEQGKKLYKAIKNNKKIKYALTHNYSSYPMVREAKNLVEKGKLEKLNISMLNIFRIGQMVIKFQKQIQKRFLNGKLIKKLLVYQQFLMK